MSTRRDVPITLTFDIEDHRPSPAWEARYPALTEHLLDVLDEIGARATFFVVGQVAASSGDLVREIARRGHEIGLHSYRHWATFSYDPDTFRREIGLGRRILEDLTGGPIAGYRAPAGTVMPRTYWATEALAELGFTYSASVLPVQSYVVGFPGAPATPFRWPSGLVEVPCPCVSFGPIGMPFLGGTFLRVLPMAVVRRLRRSLHEPMIPWTYLHPYDTDAAEPFWVVPDVSWWGSILLWINRGVALRKLDAAVRGRVGRPLAERVAELPDDLPLFDPTVAAPGQPSPAVATRLARTGMVEGMLPERATSGSGAATG